MSDFFKSIFTRRENEGIKLLVFDFDGTLADTRELLLRIVKKHLGKFNYKLSKDLIKRFGDSPLESFLRHIGLKNDLLKEITEMIHKDYIKEHQKIKPCKNLYSLKEIDKKKVILSNNRSEFIKHSLKFLKADFFDGFYGCDTFKDKHDGMKKIIKKYKVNSEEIIYTGDRAIDVLVAREAGCYDVAVSNRASWSKRKDILKQHPDFVINDLGKMKEIIEKIESRELEII